MTKAIALFSGGLDSMLAARLVMEQGVETLALQFITPFFGYKYKGREDEAALEFERMYGIRGIVIDVSKDYIAMLRNPKYGYGKNFNPCIDCKVFMMRRAKEVMEREGADMVVSGEVLGQRPMSQRRDAMRIIERDSGLDGYLLRPLCAKHMKPTLPEERGLIDRERLMDISGRSRKVQMEMAERMGIKEYQTPAGGCQLTDPILSQRVRKLVMEREDVEVEDVRILAVGRHFDLPGARLYVGRNRDENERLGSLARDGDVIIKVRTRPGPLAVLRGDVTDEVMELAARVTARYCDKAGLETFEVGFKAQGGGEGSLTVSPMDEASVEELRTVY